MYLYLKVYAKALTHTHFPLSYSFLVMSLISRQHYRQRKGALMETRTTEGGGRKGRLSTEGLPSNNQRHRSGRRTDSG